MDGWRDQRSEPRTEPFVTPLPETRATCPRCARADCRRDQRAQDSWHRAQIRACANVEKVRRDQQITGDTPPDCVGAKDRAEGSPVLSGAAAFRWERKPNRTSPDTGELARLSHTARSRVDCDVLRVGQRVRRKARITSTRDRCGAT